MPKMEGGTWVNSNLEGYLSALIELTAGNSTWIGRPSETSATEVDVVPWFLAHQSTVITACNPMGEIVSFRENSALSAALQEDLMYSGLEFLICSGRDDRGLHSERSFLIFNTDERASREAIRLAQKYKQQAIFILEGHSRRLQLLEDGRVFSQQIHWEQK